MPTFYLHSVTPAVSVELTANLTEEQLMSSLAFNQWLDTLKASLALQSTPGHPFYGAPYSLRSIKIQSVDFFGPRIGFLKLSADISNSNGERLPGIMFLRGGSVAMLMILRPSDSRHERWVIMTEQARIPAGSLDFCEIPAGMLDDDSFKGAAAKEIEEETGLVVPRNELVDMTALALQQQIQTGPEPLQAAMYPSPGGSDEFIPLFLWEKELPRQQIDELRNKSTGLRAQGERIRLKLCRYEDLWKVGARDAKSLAAWALYEGLQRANLIPS
jgi:8-oxo-dGTP pyrophosphatase MutT (NUDIX family)